MEAKGESRVGKFSFKHILDRNGLRLSEGYPFAVAWRETIAVKSLAQGHRHHDPQDLDSAPTDAF